jgi:uncharacterized protein (TIGR02118 family)
MAKSICTCFDYSLYCRRAISGQLGQVTKKPRRLSHRTDVSSTRKEFVYSNPTDPAAFEAAYPQQLALARKLPGLTRLQTSKVWPKEDGSPTPAYRLLDLYFADYAAASAAAAEARALVGATLEHATGGVVIAFAEVLEDA